MIRYPRGGRGCGVCFGDADPASSFGGGGAVSGVVRDDSGAVRRVVGAVGSVGGGGQAGSRATRRPSAQSRSWTEGGGFLVPAVGGVDASASGHAVPGDGSGFRGSRAQRSELARRDRGFA